jgi:hypothetical protein
MAATPQPYFTPDAAISVPFDVASSRVALPGTPGSDACVRLVNTSGVPVYVVLGGNTVTATIAAGVCIAPGPVPVFLGIGSNTYLAGITPGASNGAGWVPTGILNIATGS